MGSWKVHGKCNPKQVRSKCGPGTQSLTRTCTDGTINKCKSADRKTQRQCSLGSCSKKKKLGNWNEISDCIPINNVKQCGPGKILQTRDCVNGTNDACSKEDTHSMKDCLIPCAKKKVLGPWKVGKCVAKSTLNQSCGQGTKRITRKCEPGTNDPCLKKEVLGFATCDLGPCPKGNLFNFLMVKCIQRNDFKKLDLYQALNNRF